MQVGQDGPVSLLNCHPHGPGPTRPPTLPRTQMVFPTSLFKPAGLPGLEYPYLV